MTVLRVGTRGSPLAVWQARAFEAALERAGGPPCEICVIKTTGDRLEQAALSAIGGKRLFVKEIEEALIEDRIDVAVHSAKDIPALLPDGLVIGSALPREDPRDAFVLPANVDPQASEVSAVLEGLGPTPRVGTGSVRRLAQLARLMPRARFDAIRGNLDTRLRKIDAGDYDVLVLAAAGLKRLGLAHRISAPLPPRLCVPAPGQGVVAVEIRAQDSIVREIVALTNDAGTMCAVTAERAVVAALGGSCQVPIGAIASQATGELDLDATVVSLDGTRAPRCRACGPASDPEALGQRVAEELIAAGAEEILEDVRRHHASADQQP